MRRNNRYNHRPSKRTSSRRSSSGNHIFSAILIFIFILCFIPMFSKLQKSAGININNNSDTDDSYCEIVTDCSSTAKAELTVNPMPSIIFNRSSKSVLADKDILSDSAVLYDKDTNTILYSKNSDKICFPASTTKIITALVAVQNIPLDTEFTVGTELSLLEPESSLAYLNQGNVVTLEDLLYALLLPSGNDAAYVIAVNTARTVSKQPDMSDTDAVAYFCSMMNKLAENSGCENTNFMDPDGYHNVFHYTTAEDMLKIMLKVDDYPVLYKIVSTQYRQTNIKSGEGFEWENGNLLIMPDNPYFLNFATGFKTGFTDEAGYCMVATATNENRHLIAVVFNAPSLKERYTDAAKLFYSELAPDKLVSLTATDTSQTADTSASLAQ